MPKYRDYQIQKWIWIKRNHPINYFAREKDAKLCNEKVPFFFKEGISHCYSPAAEVHTCPAQSWSRGPSLPFLSSVPGILPTPTRHVDKRINCLKEDVAGLWIDDEFHMPVGHLGWCIQQNSRFEPSSGWLSKAAIFCLAFVGTKRIFS